MKTLVWCPTYSIGPVYAIFMRIYQDWRNTKSANLAKRRTVIEAPGPGLHSLQDVHMLICRLKKSSLNFPSLCENEFCTEMEEEMLNKYTCRLCVPPKFDGTLQYATPDFMLKIVPLGCTGIV